MSREQYLKGLGIAVYSACFEQYDKNREPFGDPLKGPKVTPEQAWEWFDEDRKNFCVAQGLAALEYARRNGPPPR